MNIACVSQALYYFNTVEKQWQLIIHHYWARHHVWVLLTKRYLSHTAMQVKWNKNNKDPSFFAFVLTDTVTEWKGIFTGKFGDSEWSN